MKKNIILAAFVAIIFAAPVSQATIDLGRPVYAANMEIIESGGIFAGAEFVRVTLIKGDEEEIPSEILLGVDHRDFSDLYELPVVETEVDGCGSTHYFARLINKQIFSSRSIELIDHSTRHCMDKLAGLWEAEVKFVSGCFPGNDFMFLRGFPKEVITLENLA